MALPIQHTDNQDMILMQQKWASQLNPLLASLFIQGALLTNVNLINGVTIINHYLGKQMSGWLIVDQNASANVFRSAPLNSQTLTLTSNAATTVSLWVF